MSPTSAPAHERRAPARPRVEPRLAARKSAVGRAAGRRRLTVVLAGLGVLFLVVGAFVVLHSSLLSARHLTVRGAARTGQSEVLSVTGLDRHPPLVDLNPAADEASLEALPWVAMATVTRHWPDSVTVVVTERHPVATIALAAHESALVDATGRVLADVASPPAGLVALAITAVPAPGATLPGDGRQLATVAGALPRTIAPAIASVAHGTLGVVLQLRDGASVILGNPTVLGQKMVALATVLANVTLVKNEQVDLRVPSAPVLTP